MQTTVTPPPPPLPPTVVAVPTQAGASRAIVLQPSTGQVVPQTPAELRALKTRRSEISSQLENVAARRKSLAAQIEQARVPAVQEGMVARLRVMDERIVSLESDLAETGRLLQLAPPSAYAASESRAVTGTGATGGPNFSGARIDDGTVISLGILFILAVLMPLSITAARIWWRRATGTLPARQQKAESDRFARLEEAVETIAIEMERVSEGQRFMTRMLTEGRAEVPVFGGARAEPLPVARSQHES